MGATRYSVTKIFDKCIDCQYRQGKHCGYLHEVKNVEDSKSTRILYKRLTKKLSCPAESEG